MTRSAQRARTNNGTALAANTSHFDGDAGRLVRAALNAIEARFFSSPHQLTSPHLAATYLRLQIAHLDYEAFVVVFLDAQNRPIAVDEMFRGTLTQCAIYPREIARRALTHNAAKVILAHNHPSGSLVPSLADRALTKSIRHMLAIIDVQTLDHLIVSPQGAYSLQLAAEVSS